MVSIVKLLVSILYYYCFMRFDEQVMSKDYEELVVIHKELEEDREALFAAYSTLNNKLSDIESEIME
jgi:hypothetical protein